MPNDKIKKLHKNLTEKVDGFNVPYEQFELDMQDDEKVSKLHQNLLGKIEGFNVPLEQFKLDVKKKDGLEISSETSQPLETESKSTLLSKIEEDGSEEPPSVEVSFEDTRKPERKESIQEISTVEDSPLAKAKSRERTQEEKDVLKQTIDFQTSGILDPEQKSIMAAAVNNVENRLFESSEARERGEKAQRAYYGASVFGSVPSRVNGYYDAVSNMPEEEVTLEELKKVGSEFGLDIKKDGSPNMESYTDQIEGYSKAVVEEYASLRGELGLTDKDSYLNDMADVLAKGMAGLSKNTTSLLGYAGLNAIPGYHEGVVKTYQRLEDEYEEQISRKERGVIDAVNEKEYGKALGNAVLQVTESAPILASLAMGNAAGYSNAALGFLAAEEASGRYYDLEDVDMSESAKVINSIIWGLAEAIPEKFGTSAALQSAKHAIKSGVKKEVAEDILKRSFASQLKSSTSNIVGYSNTAIRGGIDEMSTTAVQNMLDGRELTEGMADSFIVGSLTDFIVSTPEIGITAKEEARNMAIQIKNSIPKKMPLEDRMKAAELVLEKKVLEKEESGMDESFKGTRGDAVADIDNSIKLTTLSKDDKYIVNEVNKKLNEELQKENPNLEKIVYLNNYLTSKEGKSGAVIDKNSQSVIDKSTEENTDEEVISSMNSIQEKRNESYGKAFGNLDSEINSELNKGNKVKGEEVAVEVETASKTVEIKAEETKVAQEPTKETKVAEKAPKEVIKEELAKPEVERVIDREGDDLILHHGTPHDFSKFQLEKIGTGEGRQAFGWGIYFTESSKIANYYAEKLSKDKSGVVYTVRVKGGAKESWLGWRDAVTEEQEDSIRESLNKRKDEYVNYLDSVEDEKSHTGAAEMLLDEDLVLDDRPMQSAALYNDLSDAFGQSAATEIMIEAGISGIKYKSKKGKGAAYNYVVFDPSKIEVIEKKVEPKVKPKIKKDEKSKESPKKGKNIGEEVTSETQKDDGIKKDDDGKKEVELKKGKEDGKETYGTELQDRAKVEIEKKIGKIEKLDKKRKESVQKGLDSLGRLGNIKFAVDEGGKRQAMDDIVTAISEFTKAGVISAEIGTLKAIDFIKNQFSDPEAKKFIDDNKKALQDRITREVEGYVEASDVIEKAKKKAEEVTTKERRLGKKALESADLPEDFKNLLAERTIEYAVRGRGVTEKEANEIIKAYIRDGRIDEIKSVILDTRNGIPDDTRTFMAVEFAKEAIDKSNKSKTERDRKAYMEDALDVFHMDMVRSTQQAQALQSKVKWADVVASTPDLFVEYAKREQQKQNDKQLQNRTGDIKTAKEVIDDFLKSKEFKDVVDEKAKTKYDKLLEKGKDSTDRIERGKAKFAEGINKVVEAIGAKKNAVADNEISPDALEGLKEMAEGLLEIGVGSTHQLITKIKVALREYVSPTEIDKYSKAIIRETNAGERLKKQPKKQDVLTKDEVSDLVDKLYAKMAGGTKAEIRKLARDYIDVLNQGGALDEQSFKDLFASSIGLEHLRPQDEANLREMAEKLSDLRSIKNNLEELYKKFVVADLALFQAKTEGKITKEMQKEYDKLKKEIDAQAKEYKKSLEDAKEANKEVSNFFSDPRSTADLFSTFIQGNLLTPISLVTNVTANTLWLPFRGVKFAVANVLDTALYGVGAIKESLLKKYGDNPRVRRIIENSLIDKEKTYDYMGFARGYIPGFKEGLLEGIRQMRTGQLPEDAYIREIGRSLQPIKSGISAINALSGKDKQRALKTFNDSIEAILGVPPEIMFRLLNLGDKPFRRAAERARLEEIASIKGLKGAEKEMFKAFPDDNTLEEMRKAGLEATYQQDNPISDFILHGRASKKDNKDNIDKIDKKVRGALRFVIKTQIPYVKTPTNILIEAIDYAIPETSLAKAIYYGMKGDRRRSLDYMSRAIVGYMIEGAVTSMFVAGLFTFAPQGLEEDRDEAVRESEFASGKLPYSMNSDAVLRWISGGDTAAQDGDDYWSIKRFGIISAIAMGKMEAFRGKTPEEVAELTIAERRTGGYFPIFKSALDQSFVAGVNNMINALMGSEYERVRWATGTAKAISSSALPNTVAATKKYYDGYIRETRNRNLSGIERAKADIKDDFRASYLNSDGLPTKVSIWGAPVTKVPDGRGIGFVLFDITQSREYTRNFGMEIHELYERTGDKTILPKQPNREYKYDGEKFKLTNKMYEDLQIRLNSINAQVIEPIVESQDWDGMTDEARIIKLNKTYAKIKAKQKYQKRLFESEWKFELEELAEAEKE